MPGGFARVGASRDTAAIAMREGGRAADVWVLGSAPVERVTLLPAREDGAVDAKLTAILPSRAADNLFWLGRYIERAEGTVRVLRAYHGRFAEALAVGSRADAADDRREPRRYRHRRATSRSPMRSLASIDAAACERRAHPRPLLARRLAGAHGPVQDRPSLPHPRHPGRRRLAGDDRAPAQARRLRRPRAREHVSRRRLALPRDRPAARARHRDVPPDGAACPARCRRRASRPAGRGRRQRHDPSPPLQGQFRAPRGHRAAGARRVQPALDPLPARRGQDADRAS